MKENKQFFIRVNGQLVSVTEKVYREYYKMERRERYLEERDAAHGTVLYSDMDTDEILGEETIPDMEAASVEDIAIHRIMAAVLRDALEMLSDEEKALITIMYFFNGGKGMTQREAAEILGISQPAVKKRHDKIIMKLRAKIKI
jgi:RNA polymerase sigma factor (sigma-70 family)